LQLTIDFQQTAEGTNYKLHSTITDKLLSITIL